MIEGIRKTLPHGTEQQNAAGASRPKQSFGTAKELIERYPDYTYFGIRFVKCHAITKESQAPTYKLTTRTTTIQLFDRENSCSNYRKEGRFSQVLLKNKGIPDDLANYAILHDKKIIFMCSDFNNELELGIVIENEMRLENILYVRDLALELFNVAAFPEVKEIHQIDLFCMNVMDSFRNAGGECGTIGIRENNE